MKNKIIAAFVGLMMLATPAFACVGPDCSLPDDGSIDTYFTGAGWDVWFNDVVGVDEYFDDDMIVENVYTQKGEVTVLQNVDIDDKWMGSSEVVLNALITVDPASCGFGCNMFTFDASVETYATWDEDGSVFRSVDLGDVYSQVSAGADEGTFVDAITYEGTVDVYKSIGLNTNNICDTPDMPSMPSMPVCDWCVA